MPNHGKGGRPSILTDELAEQIYTYLRLGATHRMAAHAAGITEQTFSVWYHKYEWFTEGVQAAEAECHLSLLVCLHKQARRGSPVATTWLLERRGGAAFAPPAQRHQITVSAGQLEQLDDADLEAFITTGGAAIHQLGPGDPREAPEDEEAAAS